jgi:hypothetical protein
LLVLVLVVVSVARGDMDKLGNAERNEKTILHFFYAICEILYPTRDAERKKVYRNALNVAISLRSSPFFGDDALGANTLVDQPIKAAPNHVWVDVRRTLGDHCNRELVVMDCFADHLSQHSVDAG